MLAGWCNKLLVDCFQRSECLKRWKIGFGIKHEDIKNNTHKVNKV